MASTTDFIDVTSADYQLEEVWSQRVTMERMKNLVFGEQVDRQFESELKRGQKLWIGNITQPTARSKTENGAITFETVTETGTSITIGSFYYTAIALEDVVKPMVAVDLLSKYVPGLAYGVHLQEDSDVAALIDDGTITQTVGTLAVELTYDNLIRSDQYLNDANVPQENRMIISSPAQKAGWLKLDQFTHRDYSDLRTGLIGNFLGTYPIFITTNTDGTNNAGHDSVMMHKEAIAHVSQIKPAVRSWWDGDYQCVKMSCLTTYGSTIRRADHAVWMKGA
uniref:Putative capsid protein n=1 Tax=viral metagenome TaxID=1070528 RepID=A0A6M3XVC9_9ZZZZ